MISIHRGICGRSGELFIRNKDGRHAGVPDTKSLQRVKNRVILNRIIEVSWGVSEKSKI